MGRDLSELWLAAAVETVEEWAESLVGRMGPVEVLTPPRPVVVMMNARDSVEGEVFCVGELLMTECGASCGGESFRGWTLGNEPRRALALAILGAAQGLFPHLLEDMAACFDAERERLAQDRERMVRALGSTRVAFETMRLG